MAKPPLSQDEFNELVNLHRSNRLPQAEAAAKKLLQCHPDAAVLHNLLGAVLAGQRKFAAAAASFASAVRLDPQSAENHRNLGLALKDQGRIADAILSYQRAIALNPGFVEAHNSLGNAYRDQGELDAAARCFGRAIELQPGYARAYNNLGNVLRDQGDLPGALRNYAHAVCLKPDYAEACNNMGNVLREQGAAAGMPAQPEKLAEAVRSYQRAIELRPDYAEAHANLGGVHYETGRLDAAIRSCEEAIRLDPGHAGAYANLGNALRETGQLDAAIECQQRALALAPEFPEALNNLGVALQDRGRLEDAAACYRRAIAAKPGFAEAHRHLSTLTRYAAQSPHLEEMRALFEDGNLAGGQRMHLAFALGKAHEDIGEHARSFEFIALGNALRRAAFEYSIDGDAALFERIKRSFPAGCAEAFGIHGSRSERPIFIVGMPRSGTTLVEQILSSHPEVYGAGELNELNVFAEALFDGRREQGVPEALREGPHSVAALVGKYLGRLDSVAPDGRRVTDKMPLNFRWIGLIRLAFPRALVINLVRDPRDTCLSIYKTCFATGGNPYAFELRELGAYHNLYRGLMAHWRSVFPGFIHDISYEALASSQEAETRKLLACCGLAWDERCLEFYKTERVVTTASAAQVRQKMYSSSVQSWRRYQRELAPLLEVLEL